MQREGAAPDSFVQKKCHAHRIFRLNKALSTKHLEFLVRATLKSVFELCGLIASRPFSAPPTLQTSKIDKLANRQQLVSIATRCRNLTAPRPCGG
jgi:hypothetical protein